MIRDKKDMPIGPVEVDLTGPDGNAFVLMSYARKWCKQMGIDSGPIIQRMTSGDYDNLVQVLDTEFGEFVTFYK